MACAGAVTFHPQPEQREPKAGPREPAQPPWSGDAEGVLGAGQRKPALVTSGQAGGGVARKAAGGAGGEVGVLGV